MTDTTEQPQETQTPEQKQADKDYNFVHIRRQLEAERSEKAQLQERINQLMQQQTQVKQPQVEDDDHPEEPYVDHKRLGRKLAKLEANIDEKIDKKAEQKARILFKEHQDKQWMENNSDFYQVMEHAQKLAEKAPALAKSILSLDLQDNFERQKLVYENIKTLGLHKKEEPRESIQATIDKNRQNPGYQPSGVATSPYATTGDFSPSGQKAAYDKMQQLKAKLSLR